MRRDATWCASPMRRRSNHQDDTRYGRPGFGTGTIVVSTDPASGRGIGYGWHGSDSRFFYPTSVMVGRVVR